MARELVYAPLTTYLQQTSQDKVFMTFEQLNSIITIPDYAYYRRPAWGNTSTQSASSFQRGWMEAGYFVSGIDIVEGWVEFTKGKSQSRETRHTSAVYHGHIDEKGLAAAIQKGYDCYNGMQSDPHHRYLSWEHCHKVFKRHKENPDSIDNDALCLHLAWYLASWGMLRNSFLMQKDYRIHTAVVDLLFEPEWDNLWDISSESLAQEENANKIMTLCARITEAYLENGSEGKPTDTLLTKILLGTIGCVPAYDRYFRKAIGSAKAAQQQFSANSLKALGRLYIEHSEQFEPLREHCSQAGFEYPVAKIIDMCFFEYGLTLEGTDESTEE